MYKINRKQILGTILECIEGISDKEYQRRVWIRGEGPECDDFGEIICNYFGDAVPMLKKYMDFGITKNQYQILKKFTQEFQKFSAEND